MKTWEDRKTYSYMGVDIMPNNPVPHGWRWEALIEGHGFCYAQSLKDMKELIRSKVGK